jgi:hypothetical protein
MKRTVPQAVFDTSEAIRAAKQGHAQACAELNKTPLHKLGKGNPNHPIYSNKLFGYDQAEFMAKQYKAKQ